MAGQRDTEADRDWQMRRTVCATEQRGEIIRKRVLGSRHAGAGNQIEKAGGAGGDFFHAIVGGSRRGKKNGIEMMRRQDAAIVFRFFGCKIGDEYAVGSGRRRCGGEFFQPHLENWIVVAEEDDGNVAGWRIGFANFANEIDHPSNGRTVFQCAFGGALNGRTVCQADR